MCMSETEQQKREHTDLSQAIPNRSVCLRAFRNNYHSHCSNQLADNVSYEAGPEMVIQRAAR